MARSLPFLGELIRELFRSCYSFSGPAILYGWNGHARLDSIAG